MATIEGLATKEAEAFWELLASEAAHLSVLLTLKYPFLHYLQQLQNGNSKDPRIIRVLNDVDVRRIWTVDGSPVIRLAHHDYIFPPNPKDYPAIW